MNLKFGVTAKRESQNKDIFPGVPVLIVHPEPEVKGSARKFELNKAATEALHVIDNVNYNVAFAKDSAGDLFLVNVGENSVEEMFKLTLQKTFSNKKAHQVIQKMYGGGQSYLKLEFKEVTEDGMVVCKVLGIVEDDNVVSDEAIDNISNDEVSAEHVGITNVEFEEESENVNTTQY